MSITVRALIAPLSEGDRVAGSWQLVELDEQAAAIILGDGPERVVVEVRDRVGDRGCYASTRSYGLRAQRSPPSVRKALLRLAKLVSRNDQGLPLLQPARLTGSGPDQRKLVTVVGDRAMLRVVSRCDMQCVFCTRGLGGRQHDRPLVDDREDLRPVLAELLAKGARRLVITGDEPLRAPGILALVEAASDFEQVEIISSGLELAEASMLQALKQRVSFSMPIYGPNASVHDGITGVAGSFARLLAVIERLRAEGVRFRLHSILHPSNLAHVVALRQLAWERWEVGLTFQHVAPRSDDVADYARNTPPYTEVLATLKGSQVILAGYPLCVRYQADPTASGDLEHLAEGRAKLELCASCPLSERCPGTYALYLQAHGPAGIAPIEAP